MGAADSTQVPPPVQTTDTRTDAEKLADAQAELAQLRGEESTEQLTPSAPDAQTLREHPAGTIPPTSETDAEKIRRLENELTAKTTVSQIPASGTAPTILDPSIDLAAIEPGIKWGIRNGIIDPKQFGDHIVKAFENGEL